MTISEYSGAEQSGHNPHTSFPHAVGGSRVFFGGQPLSVPSHALILRFVQDDP